MPIGEQPDNIEKKATIETLPLVQESQKVESLPDVQEFAQKNISDLDSDKNEIQNLGEGESNRIEKQYQPSQELSTTFRQKLEDIAKMAGGLTEIAKKGMQGAVVGASMLVATAGFAEGNTPEKPLGKTQEGVKIEELQRNTTESNFKKSEIPKEKRGSIEFQTEGNPKEKIEKNKETELFIEIIKNILTTETSGNEYLKKLTIEFNGDEQKAIEEQSKRVENIKNVNIIVIENESEFHKKLEELKNEGTEFNGDPKKFKGVYIPDKHAIYSQKDYPALAHELIHSETRGEKDISENAQKILKDSYLKQGFLNIFSNKDDKYLSDVPERLEGKKDLDFILNELNIKKYEEPFTEKHYNEMMKAHKDGKIGGDAGIFIERTKKEFLKDILDKIALNENSDKKTAV
jgi:hypothetical protein